MMKTRVFRSPGSFAPLVKEDVHKPVAVVIQDCHAAAQRLGKILAAGEVIVGEVTEGGTWRHIRKEGPLHRVRLSKVRCKPQNKPRARDSSIDEILPHRQLQIGSAVHIGRRMCNRAS